MGSVIDHIDCPNCGEQAYNEFYYKTQEEDTFCASCGYMYSLQITTRDKKFSDLTEDDWKIVEIKEPYGALMITTYSGHTQYMSIENEEQYNNIKKSSEADVEIEYMHVSRFVNNQIVKEIIIDNVVRDKK